MFRLWLCMPFGTPYQIPGGTDPLHLFSKLKPDGQVQLLCSAFKCLHGVVLAQHPSLSAAITLGAPAAANCSEVSEHISVLLHMQFPPPGGLSPQLPT